MAAFESEWMFCGETRSVAVKIEIGRYANGLPRIQLVEIESGDPVATATMSVPSGDTADVWIKDYDENEGVVECLVRAGVLTETAAVVLNTPSGQAGVLRTLTPRALAAFQALPRPVGRKPSSPGM